MVQFSWFICKMTFERPLSDLWVTLFPSNRSYGAKAAAANAKHSFKVTEQDSYKNSKKLAKETSVKNYKKGAEDAVKTRDPQTNDVVRSQLMEFLDPSLGPCQEI